MSEFIWEMSQSCLFTWASSVEQDTIFCQLFCYVTYLIAVSSVFTLKKFYFSSSLLIG